MMHCPVIAAVLVAIALIWFGCDTCLFCRDALAVLPSARKDPEPNSMDKKQEWSFGSWVPLFSPTSSRFSELCISMTTEGSVLPGASCTYEF